MFFEEDVSVSSAIMVILATYMLVSKFMLPFSTQLVVALRVIYVLVPGGRTVQQ